MKLGTILSIYKNGIIFPSLNHARKFSSLFRMNHGQLVVQQLGKTQAQKLMHQMRLS